MIPPLNCLDGIEIPVTIDGDAPTASQYQDLSQGKIGCDNPSWLDGAGCINYNFLIHKKLNNDVDLALVCRSRKYSNYKDRAKRESEYNLAPTPESFKSLFYFDSLGMIVTNRTTGKTCFFDQVDPVYGGFIPYPDRRIGATREELPDPKPTPQITDDPIFQKKILGITPDVTWKKPFQTARIDRCTLCHDSGPWKHSPWLPANAGIPSNPIASPYVAIGPAFEYWRTTFEPTAISTAPVKVDGRVEPQMCTSCHRIGREATCKSMIDFATGHAAAGPQSNRGKQPKSTHWMPPISDHMKALSDESFLENWNRDARPHYEALKRCCNNPHLSECTATKFGH